MKHTSHYPPEYGVCDSPQQLADKYPNYTGQVWFTCVERAKQPKYGGWRWHKWGIYIGNYDIDDIEYLHDASHINMQWIFNNAESELAVCNVVGLPNKRLYDIVNGKAIPTETIMHDMTSMLSALMGN